jgi:hypothetical protein
MNTESRKRNAKKLTIVGKFYVDKKFHLDETQNLLMQSSGFEKMLFNKHRHFSLFRVQQ